MQQTPSTRRQVRRVLLVTLAFNLLVAAGKIVTGLVSGALAITADGFHSLVDSSANVVSLFANHVAAKPPDREHPYGHRRFETLAALLIGVLLVLTAWEIARGAVERLLNATQPNITAAMFAVMLATLVVNVLVSRYERREGGRLNSELLVADSAHTRADVYVTLSVLASMALVRAGLPWVDAVAALVIVALIARAALQVLRQTGSVLVDAAPYSAEQLAMWVGGVPSVERVMRARSRGPLDAVYIDVDVRVARETTTDHTDAIAGAIRDRLAAEIDGIAEVEVHFTPHEADEANYTLLARARADALGLSTHEVHISEGDGGKILEMHVEVPAAETLNTAHERVSQLEAEVSRSLPEIDEVVTHIEPALTGTALPSTDELDCAAAETRAMALLRERYPDAHWHDFRVHHDGNGLGLAAHVTLPGAMPVEEAHRLAEEAETLLRSALPALARVTIHTEPPENVRDEG